MALESTIRKGAALLRANWPALAIPDDTDDLWCLSFKGLDDEDFKAASSHGSTTSHGPSGHRSTRSEGSQRNFGEAVKRSEAAGNATRASFTRRGKAASVSCTRARVRPARASADG